MSGLVSLVVRRPWLLLGLVVVLLGVAGGGVLRLAFNDGLSHVFASNNQAFENYVSDQARFSGAGAGIAVHLKAKSFAEPTVLRAAEDFALDLGLLDGVEGSASVFSLRKTPDAQGDTRPLFSADIQQEADLRPLLLPAVRHPLNQGRLLSEDLQNMLVLVQPQSQQLVDLAIVLDDISSLGAEILTSHGVDFSVSGMPALRVSTIELLIRDQMVINVVAAGIGFVLCLIAFKGLVPAMIAGVPAVIALIFVLGFMGYWGTGINTATNALPVLILVLAFADSMHLTFETRRRLATGEGHQTAIVEAFKLAAPPCILASVTTTIAFASLMLSGSELISGLGAAGSIGVLISLCVVLLVNPLLSVIAARFDLKGWTFGHPSQPILFPQGLWQRVLDLCLRRARVVVAITLVGLVVALGIYSQAGARYSFFEYVPENGPDYLALKEVERQFAPLTSYDVMVPVQSPDDGRIEANMLARVGAVHTSLAELYGADRVVSLWSVAQWAMPENPSGAADQLTRLFRRAGLLGTNGFVSSDGELARVAVLAADPGAQQIIKEAADIEATAQRSLGDVGVRVGGLMYMSAVVASEMIFDLNRSFLAAVVFSGVLIAIWMRSLRVGVAALIINVLPISMVGAFLVIGGNQLQFTSGLALTIAFGIAVDDTLHALNRLRPKYLAGAAITPDDIRQAFGSVAPVLTATSVILSFGLGATFLSGMPSIAYFGQLSIAVFILALLADLLALPALLLFIRKGAPS